MKINGLLGVLIGVSVGIFIIWLWKGEVDWFLWGSLLIGGLIGQVAVMIFSKNSDSK